MASRLRDDTGKGHSAPGGGGTLDRRGFLRATAVAGLGAGLVPLRAVAAPEEPRIRRKVTLGRTGLEVSDIGFGSSRLDGDESLVREALDRGITYFDTAKMYKGTASETTLGRVLKGRRSEVVLVSKLKAEAGGKQAEFMRDLEGSLTRLQTDYLDVYFNHAVNDPARLANPEWQEFTARAKEQGKIRFVGMSGHGGRLVECLDYAADHDLVDVVLVGYNFGQDPAFYERFTRGLDFVAVQTELPRVLRKLRGQKVGVVAMKTLRGARLNDLSAFERDGATFAQAAFRWVFSAGLADNLIVTMKTKEQIHEYLGASGWSAPTTGDVDLLRRYEARNGTTQCRYGCNACTPACPAGVEIPEVLRTRMYAEDYGDLALAREDYDKVVTNASACLECASQECTSACPFGLPVAELSLRTHGLLGDRS